MEFLVNLSRSIFIALGLLWLPLEAFEGLSNSDVSLSFQLYLAFSVILGTAFFFFDGFLLTGFLKRSIRISSNSFDSGVDVKFGNIFDEDGWICVGVNDFFDSIVDGKIISRNSLHGHIITNYWDNKSEEWQDEVMLSFGETKGRNSKRTKGNEVRYKIGTTGFAQGGGKKFIFVALGKTDKITNITSANAESLIAAVRGALRRARKICGNDSLIIPLMGSGLSRVGIKPSVLLDLILTAIFEETKDSKVTDKITVVLPVEAKKQINLGVTLRNWK